MDLNITDFYRVLMDSVKLFPLINPAKPCLQLQTFRVLASERGQEIGTDTIGAVMAEKDTPFFWSRAWHNAKYSPNSILFNWPVLTAFEVLNEAKTPFVGSFRRTYTVEISVLDVFKHDCVAGDKTGCMARTINQIYLDTEMLLDSVFRYLGKVVVATTSADPVPKVYYLPWLEAQKTAGEITSYDATYYLESTLNSLNKDGIQQVRVEMPTQYIYGTRARIIFGTNNCPMVEYDLSLPDFGTIAFEAGCKNC